MNNMFKNLAVWMVIGLVLMTVFNQLNSRQVRQAEDGSRLTMGVRMHSIGLYIGNVLQQCIKNVCRLVSATGDETAE